jgi:hypothetical protein
MKRAVKESISEQCVSGILGMHAQRLLMVVMALEVVYSDA